MTDVDWRSPAYFSARREQVAREEAAKAWPEHDPAPLILNTDPRPCDTPPDPRAVLDLVAKGVAGGWPVRVGYSRGFKRAQRIGTYTPMETFGVWAGVHPVSGWRFSALYERPVGGRAWTWQVAIWRTSGDVLYFTDATVTDLKEFITARGLVPPAWFKGVNAREADKKSRAKLAARTRPAKRKEATG